MKENFAKLVYECLNGIVIPEARIPGVENLFETGMPCMNRYEEMMDAYERLRIRLGKEEEDDDPDVEIIINALLDNAEDLAMKMYEYGAKFQGKK